MEGQRGCFQLFTFLSDALNKQTRYANSGAVEIPIQIQKLQQYFNARIFCTPENSISVLAPIILSCLSKST